MDRWRDGILPRWGPWRECSKTRKRSPGKGLQMWDVAKVTDFSNMFKNAEKFSGDLCTWGYMLRSKNDLESDEGEDLAAPEEPDMHGIFKNTACEIKLDPEINDEKLSRGFCVKTCKPEKEYTFPIREQQMEKEEERKERGQRRRYFVWSFARFLKDTMFVVVIVACCVAVFKMLARGGSGRRRGANANSYATDLVPGAGPGAVPSVTDIRGFTDRRPGDNDGDYDGDNSARGTSTVHQNTITNSNNEINTIL